MQCLLYAIYVYPSNAQGQRVWALRLTPMRKVRRMLKRFSRTPVLTLGMFQVRHFNWSFERVFREGRTSPFSGGLELRLLSRPEIVGIVTYSVVGEIQLVWHLMVLSKEKPTSLVQVLSLSTSIESTSIPALEFHVDSVCPCHVFLFFFSCIAERARSMSVNYWKHEMNWC